MKRNEVDRSKLSPGMKQYFEIKDNYEEERLKKLRDTQFDILKNLNLEKYEINRDDEEEQSEDDLKSLLNTIAYNESKSRDTALDMLSDLKGSDDTEVFDGLKEEVTGEEKKPNITDTQMINSFYTSSNMLKNKDFEDIEDFSEDIEANNIFLKIVIAIIVVIFIVGIYLLVKTIYFSLQSSTLYLARPLLLSISIPSLRYLFIPITSHLPEIFKGTDNEKIL